MGTNIDTGGPAFPHHDAGDTGTRPGLTVRDYFAAAALNGILACTVNYDTARDMNGRVALAYKHADAMIAHRAKGGA